MKRIKYLILILVVGLFIPTVANAASGNIKVTGSSTVVLGNNVTVTVTLSSSTKIGSWQMDLNYDRTYLKLVSTTSESGGTTMANSSSSGGVTSKRYTFKFKTLKKGSTKVSVSSYLAYAFTDEEELDLSVSSKTIKIITQEELEATYSSNANLKSLKVDGYELTPAFNANTTEYSLEVPNEIESVNVTAAVQDNTADLNGTGNISLTEGNNKVEIRVTAQKGNIKTYVINIYRKELNPISVEFNGKNYGIVRKTDGFPTLTGFEQKEIDYNDEKINALYNEITDKTLIVVKDEEGDTFTIEYRDGELKNLYTELKGNQLFVSPLELPKKLDDIYEEKEIDFNGTKIKAYVLSNNSKVAIIYAQDVITGDEGYYQIDLVNDVISNYDDEVIDHYESTLEKYKYVFLGMLGVMFLLILIIIFKKPRKAKKPKEITIIDD